MPATRTYRSLDPDKVVETIGQLRHRIVERFPGAGLGEVCAELLLLAGENSARAEKIASRNIPLRIAIFVLPVAMRTKERKKTDAEHKELTGRRRRQTQAEAAGATVDGLASWFREA